MARQAGIIKLKGTIGDISFYKTKDGHLAREKTSVDAARIKNDPAFQRTRENGAEFGTAGKGGKLIRNAFRMLLQNATDSKVSIRLSTELLKVVKTDLNQPRGERTVKGGELKMLEKFEFNLNGKIVSSLFTVYNIQIDRVSGEAMLSLGNILPTTEVMAPIGTTHFKIRWGIAEIDFDQETYLYQESSTTAIPWVSESQTVGDLVSNFTQDSSLPLFMALCMEFYQEVNGELYSLKNGAYNGVVLAKIDTL